jgi:hypothetical protein
VRALVFNLRDSLVMSTKRKDGYSTFLILSYLFPGFSIIYFKRRHPQFKAHGPRHQIVVNQGSLAKRGWGVFWKVGGSGWDGIRETARMHLRTAEKSVRVLSSIKSESVASLQMTLYSGTPSPSLFPLHVGTRLFQVNEENQQDGKKRGSASEHT